MSIGLAFIRASIRLTTIAHEVVSIGLALIDYLLVSVLILIADENAPIGLVLIEYKPVSD